MARAVFRRRSLMATAAGGAAALLAGRAGQSASPPGSRALRVLCAELDCPPSIGKACLAALPADEHESRHLIGAIFAVLPEAARRTPSTTALARMLGEQISKDFGAGRIVTADGWMLSRTEVHLYALAARVARPGTSAG